MSEQQTEEKESISAQPSEEPTVYAGQKEEDLSQREKQMGSGGSAAGSNLPRSTSSIVKEALLNGPEQKVFTAKELFEELRVSGESVSAGGVSGFCSKIAQKGVLEIIATRGKENVFGNLNKGLLRKQIVKSVPGPGGQIGRQDGPHRKPRRVVTRESIRERLLELAVELESMKSNLEEFSSAELLAELTRRAKAQESRE